MQNSMAVTALDAVILVQLDVRASELSGKVQRDRDLPKENMPPAHLVSSGVRHFCDPALKQPFNTLRKAAERACSEVGVPLLKGWAIPRERATKLDEDLRKISGEYLAKADALQNTLADAYQEWEDKNPEWRELLQRDRPEPSEVRRRYKFRHLMYRLRPAVDDLDDPLNEGLGVARGSLMEAILDDVANQATDLLERSFAGRAQVTGRSAATVGVLATKLKSFAMVDPLVIPVATMIAEVVAQIGATNAKLSVTETSALRGLLELMSDPAKLRDHGTRYYKGEVTIEEAIESNAQVTVEPVIDAESSQATLFQPTAPAVVTPPKPEVSSIPAAAVLI